MVLSYIRRHGNMQKKLHSIIIKQQYINIIAIHDKNSSYIKYTKKHSRNKLFFVH